MGLKPNVQYYRASQTYKASDLIKPDFVDGLTLHEVKNCLEGNIDSPILMTDQFRKYFDLLGFVTKDGVLAKNTTVKQFDSLILHTPPKKPLSSKLKEAIDFINEKKPNTIHVIEDVIEP